MKTVGFNGKLDMLYTLDGHTPVQITDPLEWARTSWEGRQAGNWRVARDKVGKREISTVFLGMDHNHGFWEGPPILFETIVFGPKGSVESLERCCTWDEAEAQHRAKVEEVRGRARGTSEQ